MKNITETTQSGTWNDGRQAGLQTTDTLMYYGSAKGKEDRQRDGRTQ